MGKVKQAIQEVQQIGNSNGMFTERGMKELLFLKYKQYYLKSI